MEPRQVTLRENDLLFRHLRERAEIFQLDPRKIYPWWHLPCKVKVLLLTDGGLDFGPGDFGLSTFVTVLQNDGRAYCAFEITLAHRGPNVGVPGAGVTVARSIPNFRFTNSSHFTATMYDQVWLFGVESVGAGLLNPELALLSTFMNGGGGVFATGDHGELGNALCAKIPRVRSMRRWNNSSGEVGMEDPKRNDTTRAGHDAGSQFDDQSDDVPQPLQLKLYSSRVSAFYRETYPHPLMCSPLGRITVLPDHPHEGECVLPTSLTQNGPDGTPEYPLGVAPELVAFSTVPAGNTASTKQATQAQSFGAICAYDGHRGGVGRVVTDATWHHFVNINLIGELVESPRDFGQPEDASKNRESIGTASTHGFLASASGQAHFAQIKHYYVNIAVWISRPANHACFTSRFIWQLVFHHRVMEATMDNPALEFERISPALLYGIGSHATDVLGRTAGQCRRLILLLDIIRVQLPEFTLQIDPWLPNPKPDPVPNPPLPWFDFNPLLALTMGAGLLAVRDKFTDRLGAIDGKTFDEKFNKSILDVFREGARRGVDMGTKLLGQELRKFSALK